jgi:glycosyltransferase involved in cell wall biosynthesis
MPRKELEDVRYVTGNLHRLYNRRFFNKEDFIEDYSLDHKNEIVIISPLYNAKKYVEKCISSVASQLYNNYTHYIIDDLSTDNTADVVIKAIKNLPINIRDKFIFIKNTEKRNAVGNQVETIKKLHGDPIIALLDGDDRLKNDPDIFNYINREYNRGIKFTYGSFFSMADRVESIAQPYPHHVHKNKSYRNHKFNWGLPYTHLRTFKKSVFDKVDKSVFKDPNGNYWAAGGDNSMFYPLIEQCEENEIRAVQRILVMYNDMSPLNDFRVNAKEQNNNRDMIVNNNKKEEEVIVNKPTKAYIMRMPKNTISVEYAKQAAESCERIGLPYDYYDSYDHVTPNELWGGNNKYGITFYDSNMHPGAASATAGHFDLWEKIRDNKETAIILEHDAIMLHPINISIPDGMIVNLGYKLKNPDQYDHISAGAPKNIVDIASQCGAHAYAITSKTAGMLLEELKDVGALMAIDNFYFSREDKKQSSIPIGMVNPIGAIA